jgi:hypothetical protein
MPMGSESSHITEYSSFLSTRRYYTVVEGLSVQTCDGASRADLEAVIACAMAGWGTSASADGADPGT